VVSTRFLVSRLPEGLNANYSTWLLRPYIDLSDLGTGPLHARALQESWRAFSDANNAPFIPQRALAPAFRSQLAEQAGEACALTDPREVSNNARGERWQSVCVALDEWTTLSRVHRCRLASLLHSMCFYEPILALIPAAGFDARHADPEEIELAFWRASANFVNNLPERTSDYIAADISVFEDIALNAPHAPLACFNSTAKVFVHKAKTRAEFSELMRWSKRFEKAHSAAVDGADSFTAELLTSRFYRGMGFLPQRANEKSEMVRTMDLAEYHAQRIVPDTPAQYLLRDENLHAVMESRTKEALWLGDKDRALARSLKVTEVDSCDAKAWVELGEVRFLRQEWQDACRAYTIAAMLGPPAGAIGRYMAGMCFKKMGLDVAAALFFKDTLECDPLGISPRHQILNLPDDPVFVTLKDWIGDMVAI
jgi:hypothetical protein